MKNNSNTIPFLLCNDNENNNDITTIINNNSNDNTKKRKDMEFSQSMKRKRKKNSVSAKMINNNGLFSYLFFNKNENDNNKKTFPKLWNEDEFLKTLPVKLYPHQNEAIRWMNGIESSYKLQQEPKKDLSMIDIEKQDKNNKLLDHHYNYQQQSKHVGGILGDVMGLGKTIISLALIHYDNFCYENRNVNTIDNENECIISSSIFSQKPPYFNLVITTLSLLDHWYNEASERMKLQNVFIYHSSNRIEQFKKIMNDISLNNYSSCTFIIITTYNVIQKDFKDKEKSPLFQFVWHRILMDEAHESRNPKSKTFHAMKEFKTKSLWCITGTPIINYPGDLRILSLLCTPKSPLNYQKSLETMRWKKKYLLRRTKSMINIPPIEYIDKWVSMECIEEKTFYNDLEKFAINQHDNLISKKELNTQYYMILQLLLRLRQCCNHPLLYKGNHYTKALLGNSKHCENEIININNEENDEDIDDDDDENNIINKDYCEKLSNHKMEINSFLDNNTFQFQRNSSLFYSEKIKCLFNIMEEIYNEDPMIKTVIFSHFTTMLDILEAIFIEKGHLVVRYDGRRENKEIRKKNLQLFRNDPQYKILIASMKAGGVGMNLLPATRIIIFEPWWNQSVELQAADRIHRIGQNFPVKIYRILTKKTIEEEIIIHQQKKQKQQNIIFNTTTVQTIDIHDIETLFCRMKKRQL